MARCARFSRRLHGLPQPCSHSLSAGPVRAQNRPRPPLCARRRAKRNRDLRRGGHVAERDWSRIVDGSPAHEVGTRNRGRGYGEDRERSPAQPAIALAAKRIPAPEDSIRDRICERTECGLACSPGEPAVSEVRGQGSDRRPRRGASERGQQPAEHRQPVRPAHRPAFAQQPEMRDGQEPRNQRPSATAKPPGEEVIGGELGRRHRTRPGLIDAADHAAAEEENPRPWAKAASRQVAQEIVDELATFVAAGNLRPHGRHHSPVEHA